MKNIFFDGRIGRDGAEIKTTQGGKKYVKFSVANNSFAGGQEKTEWFEVTSYDPYVIENRAQYLTKGTYVIISGTLKCEVKVGKDNNMYLNYYVTATTIDTPSFKKKDESSETTEQTVSTYTASTQTEKVAPAPKPEPQPAVAAMAPQSNDDDLPF